MEAAHTTEVRGRYRRFAVNEAARHSAVYAEWALRLAEDPETVALIERLPHRLRQPNIVFAAARWLGALPGPYANLRDVLHTRWPEVVHTALQHTVQTNEAARSAVLLPALARVRGPLALIELGAAAGLCLHPDAWAYRYVDRAGGLLRQLTPAHPIGELTCTVKNQVRLPDSLPAVAHRAGIDLHPINPADPDAVQWLRTLVWPGQDERLARLDAALAHSVTHPVQIRLGDLTNTRTIDSALAACPTGTTPVLFHSAVMAYVDDRARHDAEDHLAWLVAHGRCHWISYEGATVMPGIRARIEAEPELAASLRKGAFVVALDGQPLYQADGHASWIL